MTEAEFNASKASNDAVLVSFADYSEYLNAYNTQQNTNSNATPVIGKLVDKRGYIEYDANIGLVALSVKWLENSNKYLFNVDHHNEFGIKRVLATKEEIQPIMDMYGFKSPVEFVSKVMLPGKNFGIKLELSAKKAGSKYIKYIKQADGRYLTQEETVKEDGFLTNVIAMSLPQDIISGAIKVANDQVASNYNTHMAKMFGDATDLF